MTAARARTPRPGRVAVPAPVEQPATAVRIVRALGVAAVVITPVIISTLGLETFRIPKELFATAAALSILPFLPLVLSERFLERLRNDAAPVVVACMSLAWIAFCGARMNHPTSNETVVAAWSAPIVFVAFLVSAQYRTLHLLYWLAIPAGANTIVLILERALAWSPFKIIDIEGTRPATALLGNGNDIGMTLFIATVAFIALAIVEVRPMWHVAAALLAIFFGAGVIFSYTVTALAALATSMFMFAILRIEKRAHRVVLAAVLLSVPVVVIGLVPGLRHRFISAYENARAHRYNELLSNRLEPSLAAIEMFRAQPITGLGPAAFDTYYFDYKLKVDQKYRTLMPEDMAEWSKGRLINFSETHNEYLQIAAELGTVGVLLFLAGLVVIGSRSLMRSKGAEDDCARFARTVALPLASGFAVLCIAQFPFRIAAPRVLMTAVTALVIGWTPGRHES